MAPAPFMEPIPAYGIKPHSGDNCRGNCRLHPLVVGPVAEMVRLMGEGLTWGDIAYYEEKEMKAIKTQPSAKAQPAVKAPKKAAKKKVRFADSRFADSRFADSRSVATKEANAQPRPTFDVPEFFQSALLFWDLPQDSPMTLIGADFCGIHKSVCAF